MERVKLGLRTPLTAGLFRTGKPTVSFVSPRHPERNKSPVSVDHRVLRLLLLVFTQGHGRAPPLIVVHSGFFIPSLFFYTVPIRESRGARRALESCASAPTKQTQQFHSSSRYPKWRNTPLSAVPSERNWPMRIAVAGRCFFFSSASLLYCVAAQLKTFDDVAGRVGIKRRPHRRKLGVPVSSAPATCQLCGKPACANNAPATPQYKSVWPGQNQRPFIFTFYGWLGPLIVAPHPNAD